MLRECAQYENRRFPNMPIPDNPGLSQTIRDTEIRMRNRCGEPAYIAARTAPNGLERTAGDILDNETKERLILRRAKALRITNLFIHLKLFTMNAICIDEKVWTALVGKLESLSALARQLERKYAPATDSG